VENILTYFTIAVYTSDMIINNRKELIPVNARPEAILVQLKLYSKERNGNKT